MGSFSKSTVAKGPVSCQFFASQGKTPDFNIPEIPQEHLKAMTEAFELLKEKKSFDNTEEQKEEGPGAEKTAWQRIKESFDFNKFLPVLLAGGLIGQLFSSMSDRNEYVSAFSFLVEHTCRAKKEKDQLTWEIQQLRDKLEEEQRNKTSMLISVQKAKETLPQAIIAAMNFKVNQTQLQQLQELLEGQLGFAVAKQETPEPSEQPSTCKRFQQLNIYSFASPHLIIRSFFLI